MSNILAKVSLSWLWQPTAVNIASAGLVALGGYTFKKRTAFYLGGIQEAAEARRECGKQVLDILALCKDLEGTSATDGTYSPSLQGERERWIGQLDEATRWLADNWQLFALTYVKVLGLGKLMAEYAGAVRGEWLSNHLLEQRVHRIWELTALVQDIYFAGGLRSARRRPDAIRELRETISPDAVTSLRGR